MFNAFLGSAPWEAQLPQIRNKGITTSPCMQPESGMQMTATLMLSVQRHCRTKWHLAPGAKHLATSSSPTTNKYSWLSHVIPVEKSEKLWTCLVVLSPSKEKNSAVTRPHPTFLGNSQLPLWIWSWTELPSCCEHSRWVSWLTAVPKSRAEGSIASYYTNIVFHPRVFWDFFKFKANISNWTEACWTVEHLPPRHWHLSQPVQHLGSEGCRAMLIPLSMGLLSIGISKPLLIGLSTMPWC